MFSCQELQWLINSWFSAVCSCFLKRDLTDYLKYFLSDDVTKTCEDKASGESTVAYCCGGQPNRSNSSRDIERFFPKSITVIECLTKNYAFFYVIAGVTYKLHYRYLCF